MYVLRDVAVGFLFIHNVIFVKYTQLHVVFLTQSHIILFMYGVAESFGDNDLMEFYTKLLKMILFPNNHCQYTNFISHSDYELCDLVSEENQEKLFYISNTHLWYNVQCTIYYTKYEKSV